jgi:hypothetical protein
VTDNPSLEETTIPAEVELPKTPIPGVSNDQQLQFLQSQLVSILHITTATAAQVQWITEQITMFYQSMPPFMRKGLVPGAQPAQQ